MVFELVVTCVGIVVGGKSSRLTGRLPTKGAVTSVAAISVTKSPGITIEDLSVLTCAAL